MITAGIDMGAKNIKVVLLDDGKRILAKSQLPGGTDTKAATERAFAEALGKAGLKMDDVRHITSTGTGRTTAPYAKDNVTEVSAGAKGAVFLHPGTRTVIDVGAEEGKCLRCDAAGKVIDFAVNEKCAAGAGSFMEAMARALEVPLEELGPLALKSTKTIPMNAQCAVFAESEVVTLVHQKTAKEDIARAVNDAIADRITSMVRKVGFDPDVVLIGGVARNKAFVEAIKRNLQIQVMVPEDPEYVGALGAALAAAELEGVR
ncbi:MAG: acyl-CoA dehydratase activase [Thermoplasmata archaeon]